MGRAGSALSSSPAHRRSTSQADHAGSRLPGLSPTLTHRDFAAPRPYLLRALCALCAKV